MVGNYNSISSLEANATSQLRVQVPLFFWFNRDYDLALPLIALQYHEVKFNVYFNNSNAITNYQNLNPNILSNFTIYFIQY